MAVLGSDNITHSTDFKFNINSADRVTIDTSGRLLVGTSTARGVGAATTSLALLETTNATLGLGIIRNSADTAGAILSLGKSRGSSVGANTVVVSGDTVGEIRFAGADGTDTETNAATIAAQVDGTPGSNDMPGRLVFSTTADGANSPTERGRITSAGDVGIGFAAPNTRFSVNSNSASTVTNVAYFCNAAGTGATGQGVRILMGGFQNNLTRCAAIESAISNGINGHYLDLQTQIAGFAPTTSLFISPGGSIFFPKVGTTASAANAFLNSGSSPANQLLRSTSSLRYKTDIEDLEQERSDSILNFRPVWYRSLAEADRNDWSWYGLIAEEVAEIEPRLVHWTYLEDAYEEVEGERQLKPDAEMVPDGVQYDRLTVLLLDVVQRQQKAIETLEAKVAALEAQ